MVVQQHVLNWLYSVLTSEYHDVNRTYNDVAQALSQYPSLSPRTDVHTFPTGASALLLLLSGTIPVVFRGTTYRFPISLWVPHAYPREAPLVYVTPTENMMVRPGQHVDPQGQVYHPYLVGWSTFWDKSTILDFLAILQDIFAKEPPVVARQQGQPPPQQQTPTPPPVPPLPPDLAPRPVTQTQPTPPEDATRPPPPPPKPGTQVEPQQQRRPTASPQASSGPPAPPPPPKVGGPASQYVAEGARIPQERLQHERAGPSRYETAPPLPPQASHASPEPRHPYPPPAQHPAQHPMQHLPPHNLPYQTPPPAASFSPGPPQPQQPPFPPADPRRLSTSVPPQQYGTPPPPVANWQQPPPPVQPQPQPKPPPPPDLMDDDLTLTIPSPSSAPPPPIPPNPEKDLLLHQLAQTLYSRRQSARSQNEASLLGLQAQRNAMLSAAAKLQAESAQLNQLSALLASNTAILQDSLRKADAVIENSARHPEPDIDELLVAPTVVGNQLYELVAEERALADAIFVLGRAVERGRIAPHVFAKMTRALSREWYLKKALVRKIGVGMGLS
ncbi:Suppressor protein stp22 of temperature-sensitive alpha-factor receptor and arginine permease [Madurella fahalii]|uniref:Suppressor protein stp22 of temperature-sensitive alpha-factor receptor and arginine permease n=1 Tax=Madurella fahalii TaxID=1157608 RepID=A0ABQ0GFC9_9PEZI